MPPTHSMTVLCQISQHVAFQAVPVTEVMFHRYKGLVKCIVPWKAVALTCQTLVHIGLWQHRGPDMPGKPGRLDRVRAACGNTR